MRCLNEPLFDRYRPGREFHHVSGLDIVLPNLRDAIDRGAKVRILTTDYLDITDPDALSELLDLCDEQVAGNDQLRGQDLEDHRREFPPQGISLPQLTASDTQGFVGSSNLSRSGIDGGIEWNVGTKAVDQLLRSFDLLWSTPERRGAHSRTSA